MDRVSDDCDIVWLKFKTHCETCVFCFFYVPGDHKPLNIRNMFYNELRNGYNRCPPGTKIVLMGHSNARLGSYSKDRGLTGNFILNNNEAFFWAFMNIRG